MEENTQSPTLMAHAVRSGVIIGAIGIIISLILYVANPDLLVSMWLFLILILDIILMVIFGAQYRNQTGGFISFGNAWKHGFITLVVAGLLGILYNLLLYYVIDPELPAYLTDVAVENAGEMARSFGADDATAEQAMEDARERTADQYTAGGMLLGFGIQLIVYAVIALITGAIVKKNNPEEEI